MQMIYAAARELLQIEIQKCSPNPLRLRLMGVRMSNLSECKGGETQVTIHQMLKQSKKEVKVSLPFGAVSSGAQGFLSFMEKKCSVPGMLTEDCSDEIHVNYDDESPNDDMTSPQMCVDLEMAENCDCEQDDDESSGKVSPQFGSTVATKQPEQCFHKVEDNAASSLLGAIPSTSKILNHEAGAFVCPVCSKTPKT
jgi:hypothetical protein